MIFQNCQYMVQITERIQVIRLCCFCYTVDDRPGFRTIDTVDQFPCMFLQTEAAERSFRYVVIKGSTTVSIRNTFSASSWYSSWSLPVFSLWKGDWRIPLLLPMQESLYQKFDCHPVLMVYRIRCKKVPN